MVRQQFEVDEPMGIGRKDGLALVPPVNEVMRMIDGDDSGKAGHSTLQAA